MAAVGGATRTGVGRSAAFQMKASFMIPCDTITRTWTSRLCGHREESLIGRRKQQRGSPTGSVVKWSIGWMQCCNVF